MLPKHSSPVKSGILAENSGVLTSGISARSSFFNSVTLSSFKTVSCWDTLFCLRECSMSFISICSSGSFFTFCGLKVFSSDVPGSFSTVCGALGTAGFISSALICGSASMESRAFLTDDDMKSLTSKSSSNLTSFFVGCIFTSNFEGGIDKKRKAAGYLPWKSLSW